MIEIKHSSCNFSERLVSLYVAWYKVIVVINLTYTPTIKQNGSISVIWGILAQNLTTLLTLIHIHSGICIFGKHQLVT